jgi:uncharacterized protein (DUF433 family)
MAASQTLTATEAAALSGLDEARRARFDAWKKSRVLTDERVLAGEPTFPESRLAIRHVGGMLLRGASMEEVREDYPYLRDEDIEFATIFTKAYPCVDGSRSLRLET